MLRKGFDATWRNRKIGTKEQGKGRDNVLSVPWVGREVRSWWEQLKAPQILERTVENRRVRFILEAARRGCEYACSVDDVCDLLTELPLADWEGLTTFVFRQSTRKQWLLHPVWGRLAMAADVGEIGKGNLHTGPAIVLEALDLAAPLRWSRSLTPSYVEELNRLKADGHRIEEDARGYTILSTRESARQTQLYRTIPHEIGHWVDWLERVERPSGGDKGRDHGELVDRYWACASEEREQFAHAYADRWAGERKARG